jgi:formamidopyrimidine-DNA glycosylase
MTILPKSNAKTDILGNFHHLHPAPAKHDHVVLDMADGTRISFNDARRFGSMDLITTNSHEAQEVIDSIGNYKPELDVTDDLGLELLSR